MTRLTYVRDSSGDGEAFYVDNDVVSEGHSINWGYEVLPLLVGKTIESFEEFETEAFGKYSNWSAERLDQFEDGELTPA